MPSVHPPAQVLVTGATGFIGSWTVRAFLERGYDVRSTVRTKEKGDWILHQEWVKSARGKFEYVIVEDIELPGAFDEAVKDIAAVVHIASPVMLLPGNWDPTEICNPAVNGTLAILNSVFNYGSAVRRVVVTSSVGAIVEPTEERRVFTEEDWNLYSIKQIETKGGAATPADKYRASKVKAEKAAWDFAEQHKEEINFDITAVLPGFAYGPIIHDVPSFDKLNASTQLFYEHVHKEVPLHTMTTLGSYVDVRDVATMHVDVVESDKAAGQRFIANAAQHTWQDIYDALNSHENPISGIPVGTPGAGKTVFLPIVLSNEKAKTILGTKFRTLGEMSYDTVVCLKERGFW